jgi:hypothetical protein
VIVGVSDHNGWVVLVTVGGDGALLDRRRAELVDDDLPRMPHHHEAQALSMAEALDLVERVRRSAGRHARRSLEALALAVPEPIQGMAIRRCPPLPPTVAERIKDYRAQNVADTVMYRGELARAGEERGWAIHWYDARRVMIAAGEALQIEDPEAHLLRMRKSIGPPWGKDQMVAMAAAIVAARAHPGQAADR